LPNPFHTQFCTATHFIVCLHLVEDVEQKKLYSQRQVIVVLLYLMHLLAMFMLVSSAANRNQCMEQIISSTYRRQPSPKLCVSMDLENWTDSSRSSHKIQIL
jgi:hypothetical protein